MAKSATRRRVRRAKRIPIGNRIDVTRAEFNRVIEILNERGTILNDLRHNRDPIHTNRADSGGVGRDQKGVGTGEGDLGRVELRHATTDTSERHPTRFPIPATPSHS